MTLVDNNIRFTSAILKDASNSTPLQHVDGRLYKLYIFRVTCAMSYNPGALFITVTKFLRLPQALRYCIIRRNRFNYYRRNIVFVSVSVSVFVSGLMQLYNKRAVRPTFQNFPLTAAPSVWRKCLIRIQDATLIHSLTPAEAAPGCQVRADVVIELEFHKRARVGTATGKSR